MTYKNLSFAVLALGLTVGMNTQNLSATTTHQTHHPAGQLFGTLDNGKKVEIYTIANAHGMQARVMTLGATLVSLRVPDEHGKLRDVILGYDKPQDYLTHHTFFGATIGRYGNRIGGARFTLNGKEYKLAANENGNILHGGVGFDQRIWKVLHVSAHSIELGYHSPDGEDGFPGNLNATVQFTITPENSLRISYGATTDKPTVVNLTNHSYFNLDGQGNGTILHQILKIDADHYTPVNAQLIPTGKIEPVAGTPLDFRKPTPIGAHINEDFPALKYGHGYDINYVLNKRGPHTPAAVAYSPNSGIEMEVFTDQPGIQFYTANGFDGSLHGKEGKAYQLHAAFCMETQHFPDSPNQPSFPSTELKPGQHYHTVTTYHFTIHREKH